MAVGLEVCGPSAQLSYAATGMGGRAQGWGDYGRGALRAMIAPGRCQVTLLSLLEKNHVLPHIMITQRQSSAEPKLAPHKALRAPPQPPSRDQVTNRPSEEVRTSADLLWMT